MSIKFKDVAHHYLGCKVVAPLSFYEGFETTLVAYNFTNSFANGIGLQSVIDETFKDLKPKLKPLEGLTDDILDSDYKDFETIEKEAETTQDVVRVLGLAFNKLCQDGWDMFGLIDSGEAIPL